MSRARRLPVSRTALPGTLSRWRVLPALLVVIALLASERQALACPSCFGQAEGPMIDAARLGIWLLLGLTLALQGGFAAFFLYLRRRSAHGATDHSRTTDPAPGARGATSGGA